MTTTAAEIDQIIISWEQKSGKKYLKFSFKGSLTEEVAGDSIMSWKREFSQVKAGDKVDLIWDCLEMSKYSAKAAKMWKDTMKELNNKVDCIWLISTNTFIRMGAKTIIFLLPINLKVVSSEEEVL